MDHDVVICGGGLAALLLARQLQLYQPGLSILVIDKASVPSPVACHKVGESIPEGGAYHLRHTVALEDYLFTSHMPKFGFRFFFGGGATPLVERLEYGGTQWPPFATFQLDRGILENDLRVMVAAKGATIRSECRVTDIELLGRGPHRVRVDHHGESLVFTGRWVVDATGRRRLLASKLGLKRPADHRVGACWWRVDGRVDIERLVDETCAEWHARTGPPRWYSTVHLAGAGYWMWLIPLVSGKTSIGIVADDAMHPTHERSTLEDAMAWCGRHEPQVAELLRELPALDFGALKNFAYSMSQVFSHQRWCCIGDAAVLADPLYALGQDLIGHAVTIAARLIELDRAGGLTEEVVAGYDRMFLSMYDIILTQYQGMYPTFGSPFLYTQKLAWDSSMYFAILQQTLMQNVYDHPEAPRFLCALFERLAPLNRAMQRLFSDCHRADGRLDILEGMRTWAPRVTRFADSSLDKCAPRQLPEFFEERLGHLEGIATAIFGDIVRHSPSIPAAQAERVLRSTVGIEPRAVGLDPRRWDEDGLFDQSRPPLDLDVPAQFDVQNRLRAEQRDFRPVHVQFRASAAEHHDRVALEGEGVRLTYGEVLEHVERLAAIVARMPGQRVGIELPGVAACVQAMLAVLWSGKAFVVLEPEWDEPQRRFVRERFGVQAILTDEQAGPLLRGGATGRASASPAACVDEGDIRSRSACCDVRFTEHGPRAVTLDHGALFRMCRWLPILVQKGLPEATDARELRCLWAGPVSPEAIVPLLMGCRLQLADATDGPALLGQLEARRIEVMFGRPRIFQGLVDAGWPADGLRVVSVRDALPKPLSLALRSRAHRVCDFGYATFAH